MQTTRNENINLCAPNAIEYASTEDCTAAKLLLSLTRDVEWESGEREYIKSLDIEEVAQHKLMCYHCKTRTTPQWRKGHEGKALCNKCGIKYSKGYYCEMCLYIFTKEEINCVDWVGCRYCGKMGHVMCVQPNYTCRNCKQRGRINKSNL